ncbi:hypothetical protein IWW34DRAFT_790856 [Fusarium oxysporum f. sp. albedinis]|nr:hypothetical protein IWW34DRAFT_790856 [Fusarium oxysporum f. sp. albedinis]
MDNQPLPSEILYRIFEYFCLHCQETHSVSHEQILYNKTDKSRRALLSLSRTCKSWGCIAQNVLHHYFKHSDDRRQILFCRTICENPELGERLQVASLHRSAGIDHHLFAQLWFKESMASCTVSWGDYIAPIILLRAPNLKHLVVHGPYNPSIFEEFSMEAVLRNRALPQKLESLSVGQQEISCLWHLEPRVRTDLDALGGFLMRLENLETLSISRPNLKRLPEKLPLQKLRRLRIGNACLSKDTLQRLINSTGSLEEFVYREIEGTAESTVTRLVTSQEIFEMLIPMKDRLREESLMLLLSKRTVAYQPVNGVGLFTKASMLPSLFENA